MFREEDVKEEWVKTIKEDNEKLRDLLLSIKQWSSTYNFAYSAYMAIRLLEMRRVLKDTGSIYLHCDPTMSHYIKLMMDCIFGEKNFINEIAWQRYAPHSLAGKAYDNITDIILLYSKKKDENIFSHLYRKLTKEEAKDEFSYKEEKTKRRFKHASIEKSSNAYSAEETRTIHGKVLTTRLGWVWTQKTIDERLAKNPYLIYWTKHGRPRYKIYLDEYLGRPIGNIWVDKDVGYLTSGSKERTGYPTQKPLALLDRIIKVSSNEGDIVLDPFCGCATTCVASEGLKRKWIGIDVSIKAYDLVRKRLKKELEKRYSLMYSPEVHLSTDPPKRTDKGATDVEKKFVYIISNTAYPSEYKVGIAKDWQARLNSYQTSDPKQRLQIGVQATDEVL